MSEIPTNRLRAYNVALASLTHWLHNLAVSKATPFMLVSSPYGAYFIFGSINIVMAIAGCWVPETKGVSLPGTVSILYIIANADWRYLRSPWSVWTRSLAQRTSRTSRMLVWRQGMLKRLVLTATTRRTRIGPKVEHALGADILVSLHIAQIYAGMMLKRHSSEAAWG